MSINYQSKTKVFDMQKKWSDLDGNEKEWIMKQLKDEYLLFILMNEKKPNQYESDKILDEVYKVIQKKSIWIPFSEVKKRWNIVRDIANRAVPHK